MILHFHTGIVNRLTPEIPSDVSVDRMRATTLSGIARRFPMLTIVGAHMGNPDYAWAAEYRTLESQSIFRPVRFFVDQEARRPYVLEVHLLVVRRGQPPHSRRESRRL